MKASPSSSSSGCRASSSGKPGNRFPCEPCQRAKCRVCASPHVLESLLNILCFSATVSTVSPVPAATTRGKSAHTRRYISQLYSVSFFRLIIVMKSVTKFIPYVKPIENRRCRKFARNDESGGYSNLPQSTMGSQPPALTTTGGDATYVRCASEYLNVTFPDVPLFPLESHDCP